MARYRFSREAAADIEAIAFYTREQWGAAQAVSYVESLLTTCRRIADMPEIGAAIEGFDGTVRRYRSGHHVPHYRIKGDVVEIAAFRHERSRDR